MYGHRLIVALVVVLAVSGGPAVASAGAPKPPAGPWTLHASLSSGGGSFELVKGTGTHRGSLYVRKLKATTIAGNSGCPAAATTYTLVGKVKLRTFRSGAYTSWGFGKQNKTAPNQIDDLPVRFTTAGASIKGGLHLVWDYSNLKLVLGAGITTGTCPQFPLDAVPAKK